MILKGDFVLGFRSSFFLLPCCQLDLYGPHKRGGYTRPRLNSIILMEYGRTLLKNTRLGNCVSCERV